jgi:serine/threonine-protein kinase
MATQQAPTEADVREQLARILGGSTFQGVKRLRDLLSFLVEAQLAGRAAELKEYTLATQALGRSDTFDPRIDPIARVEASRLRNRLEHYYATEGSADPVVVSLPKGGYAPQAAYAARTAAPAAAPRRPSWMWLAAGAALLAVGLGAGWLIGRGRPAPPAELPPLYVEAALGAPGVLAHQAGSAVAISPDGSTVVMILLQADGGQRLYARRLDALQAIELPGTAGADGPFFSPDGKWVGFYAGAKLKKTLVDGSGSPVVLADIADFLGAAWLDTGEIILTINRRNALWRVPDTGGTPTLLADFGGDTVTVSTPRWEEALPGGRGIIFTSNGWGPDSITIEYIKADGTGRKLIRTGGSYPRYAASGHLLYVERGTLYAVKFDLERIETVGEPWPVLEDVAYGEGFGFADYDVADNGRLVYWRQPNAGASVLRRLTPEGSAPLIEDAGRYFYPRVSPDGRRVAYTFGDGDDMDLWIYDISARSRVRVENGARGQMFPLWTPDSRFLFNLDNAGPGIVWRSGDGTGPATPLLRGLSVPISMTPDGGRLAYYKMGERTVFDLWTAPISQGPNGLVAGPEEVFRQTPFVETYPVFSPDGKWIAYATNESGWFEVYVRAFPDRDGRAVKVSSNGGRVSAWTRTHIFYASNSGRLMSAPWRVRDGQFELADAPRQWSPVQLADTGVLPGFSMSADGAIVAGLMWPDPQIARGDKLAVVQNIFTTLRRGPAR